MIFAVWPNHSVVRKPSQNIGQRMIRKMIARAVRLPQSLCVPDLPRFKRTRGHLFLTSTIASLLTRVLHFLLA